MQKLAAAAVTFDATDKPRMERMCRYLARPPIAQHRLTRRWDGTIQYTMKKSWRDGTRAIVLQPLDLIARLCAMIPPSRVAAPEKIGRNAACPCGSRKKYKKCCGAAE